jgi:prepilin-type processing-associated H-X9-DG protein
MGAVRSEGVFPYVSKHLAKPPLRTNADGKHGIMNAHRTRHRALGFNLDAPATYPQLILAGDRNVSADSLATRPGLLTVSTNTVVGWGKTELHRGVGNLLMADGSCQQVTSNGLNVAFAAGFSSSTNITSARLVIP